jgi:hypothetical protein
VRVLGNMLVVLVELALVAAAGMLAWRAPVAFAVLTLLLALGLGLRLEQQRLAHEMPFYFAHTGRWSRALRVGLAGGEAVLKAIVAGGIALVTFSGTELGRLAAMAAIFAGLVLVGSMALRRATLSLGMRPARWGFFRMAVPLGILYSLALSAFPAPTLGALAWRALFDLPARPSLAQLGETLFHVRLWADDLIVRVIAVWLGADGARLAGLLVSSNVLTGFLVALYAVAVSEVVRHLEERQARH